jgi:hypothetical protein
MRTGLATFITITCMAAASTLANAQSAGQFDLSQLYTDNKLTVFNRDITVDAAKKSIELSQELGEGLVWINGVSFTTGTIEVDLRGKDLFQHSFLGIAFHGMNDSTFEAIYFRPFQFRTTDPVRKLRGIQYISLPVNTWQKLRAEYNGVYENEVKPVPDPDDWFHAKIVVTKNEVLVYANDAATPCLQAPLLSKGNNGRIALYVADQSGGTFAKLVIRND